MARKLEKGMIVKEFGTDEFFIFSDKGTKKMRLEVLLNDDWLYIPLLGQVKKSDFTELYKVVNETGVVTDEKLINKIEKQLL